MQPLTMRRLIGVLLIIVAGAFWYTKLAEVDMGSLNLPEQLDLPIFWIGYGVLTAWCMVPQLIRTPGAKEVNLLPNAPMPFSNQMMANSDPFQMHGMWYVQWEGVLWVWDDATSNWTQAQAPPQY